MTIFYEPKIIEMTKVHQHFFDRVMWRGGCYRIKVSPVLTWPGQIPMRAKDWLKENTKSRTHDTLHHEDFLIEFKTIEEAMAFKLRWL